MTTWCNGKSIEITRSAGKARRHLVYLVTSGARPRVTLPDLAGRTFDLAVRYYAPPAANDELLTEAEFVFTGGLSKFHAVKLFLEQTGVHHAYDGVVFLDDDIEVSTSQLNQFLDLVGLLRLDLAQPALTADSAVSWPITVRHPSFLYRTTNFVEVMMPFMSRRALLVLAETFDKSISSYGLDHLWPWLLRGMKGRVGIVDAIEVAHRRPIERETGAFYRYLETLGIEPFAEGRALRRSYGKSLELPRTIGGLQLSDLPKLLRTWREDSASAQQRAMAIALLPILDRLRARALGAGFTEDFLGLEP